eukprot:1046938_1
MGHCFRIIATFSLSMTACSNVVTAKYQVDEHTIFGFIRRMEERYFSNIRACIPMDVTQIILQYYHLINEWDTELKSDFIAISHSSKGTCVRNTEVFDPENTLNMRTIFGKNVISKGTHEWRFRIVSGNKIGTS